MCTYNLLVWKWIDKKSDIKWMYLLCFIFVDTTFLLFGAVFNVQFQINGKRLYGHMFDMIFSFSYC